jgi:dienelactone hydrolase
LSRTARRPLHLPPALLALLLLPGHAARPQSTAATPPNKPADKRRFEQWRKQIKQALFIPESLPAITPHDYGTFTPVAGVTAERVTYATLYRMRVPAIVYHPAKSTGRLPGIVIVNGHAGDKTSWYAYYSGILYARAGAVVITYDPVGEDERNITRASETRAHDTLIPGPQMPERLGGQMIADILQSVSYLAQRTDVDPARIAVAGYSMGSFHSAIAGSIDPRIHALILSGGGNLSGDGDYWDISPKVMCQSGPYKALSFLSERGPVLYALNQNRGATFIMNGTADPLIVSSHSQEPFFEDLRTRTAAITGTRTELFETYWIPDAGHRPNFVTRPAALWLQSQLNFPNWTVASINSMPEVHISEWATQTGAHIGSAFANEASESGIHALDVKVPNLTRDQLQAVPTIEWEQNKNDFVYESWVARARAASKSTSTTAATSANCTVNSPPKANPPRRRQVRSLPAAMTSMSKSIVILTLNLPKERSRSRRTCNVTTAPHQFTPFAKNHSVRIHHDEDHLNTPRTSYRANWIDPNTGPPKIRRPSPAKPAQSFPSPTRRTGYSCSEPLTHHADLSLNTSL